MLNTKPFRVYLTALACVFFVGAVTSKAAADDASEIVNNLVNAYGGSKLLNLTSIKLIDYNKGPWPGESETPGIPEIWRINEELTIDFKENRKSLLSYRVPRTTLDLEKWIFEDGKTVKYDILHSKYSMEDWATFDWLGGSIVRSSDTMQVRKIHANKKDVVYIGDEYYRGNLHHKILLTTENKTAFTYYIDAATSLIGKIKRNHPRINGEMYYILSNHQKSDGIVFSRDMNFFVNGQLRLTSVEREIDTKPDLVEAFKGFREYANWGQTIDNSQMKTIMPVANVYQTGKGRSMTIFVEEDDHFVAIGGANAIAANYENLQESANTNKPIKYFVVTHHHQRGNLAGLDDVVNLGAQLVVASGHKETVLSSLKSMSADESIVTVANGSTIELGKTTLYNIATAHSQQYLASYIASAKTLVADEHYETDLATTKPRIYKDMVIFNRAIKSLNIDIDTLIDVRSRRSLNYDEFTLWTDEFKPKVCPQGYSICSAG